MRSSPPGSAARCSARNFELPSSLGTRRRSEESGDSATRLDHPFDSVAERGETSLLPALPLARGRDLEAGPIDVDVEVDGTSSHLAPVPQSGRSDTKNQVLSSNSLSLNSSVSVPR
ncbi:hypothetical protein KM043_000885 [Ampulex compressa]|nr:hypothetical protein KM043_000885 [Ampulex compressa]